MLQETKFLDKLLLALRSVLSKKRQGKRICTIQRFQVVRLSLSLPPSLSLSLSPSLSPYVRPVSLRALSFAKVKSQCSSDQKRNLFFLLQVTCLITALQRVQAQPTADGAEGGGGVATLIEGLACPNARQQYGCNLLRTVRRCQVVRSCLLHILSVSGLCLLQKEN